MPTATLERNGATDAAAIGLLALGMLSAGYGELFLQWQPAPRAAMWRTPAADLPAAILLVAGFGLLIPRMRRLAAQTAAFRIAVRVLALHILIVIVSRGSVLVLLGVAEASAMAIGFGLRRDLVRRASASAGCRRKAERSTRPTMLAIAWTLSSAGWLVATSRRGSDR